MDAIETTPAELLAVAAGCASPEATAHVARELENEQSEASRLMHALFAEAEGKNGGHTKARRNDLAVIAESLAILDID